MVLLRTFAFLLFLLCATGAFSQIHDEGFCYQQYIPPHNGFPQAICRRPIGGNPTFRDVFIRNALTCCRRRAAAGWGDDSSCKPCSAIRGFLSPWGDWSRCSKSCGRGEQRRIRYCSNGVCAGVRGRRQSETRTCVWKTCCPDDGNWASWSHWSDCSESCGDGLQYRTRTCSNPSPRCGGDPCSGFPRQMQRCQIGPCAKWSSWVTSGVCSVTCGIGTMMRSRFCYSPMGDECEGESIDFYPCSVGSCVVDGKWCSWSSWSTCTTTCNHSIGTRKRSRSCACPAPENEGRECSGSDGDVEQCLSKTLCPIDGDWSLWSSWSSCSSERCSLQPGTRSRSRACDNPMPKYGGQKCRGKSEVKQECLNLESCQVEGVYGQWSAWSPCTSSCGSCGIKLRTRKCIHMVEAPNTEIIGNPEIFCDSDKELGTESCYTGLCPDGSNPCGSVALPADDKSQENAVIEDNFDMYQRSDQKTGDVAEASTDYSDNSYDYSHGYNYYSGDHNYEVSKYSSYDYDQTHESNGFNVNSEDVVPDSWTRLDLPLDGNIDDNVPVRALESEDDDETPNSDSVNEYEEDDDTMARFEDSVSSGEGPDSPLEILHEDQIAGCNEMNNLKGKKLSRAKGCCEVLAHGMNNSDVYSPERLEECFTLHFQAAVDHADSMYDADQLYDNDILTGRGVQRNTCIYEKNERFLQTICCLMKDCNTWKNGRLRYQCKVCRGLDSCQSCLHLLISG
uniref:properdin-like n=1 Tax=Styela clava TaxID=7725 RepID=UPI00193A0193|nr:properdin-like [Styela clava]